MKWLLGVASSQQLSQQDLEAMMAGMGIVMILVGIGAMLIGMFFWGMIFSRAGYSFAMVFLLLIPVVNLIWLLMFAFSKWPIQKEVESLRARAMGGYPPPGYPPPQYPPQAYPQQAYPQQMPPPGYR